MKTIKLSALLLGSVLFLGILTSTISADASAMKTSKSDSERFGDARFMPRTNNDTNWTRKSYEDEYPRGKIRTH